jgi:hypothetical protein
MEQPRSTIPERKKDLERHLPQSEGEWLETNYFKVENVIVDDKSIRCAFSQGVECSGLVTMVGGVPRDPERRKQLPLINKLYGHLAVKLAKVNESSVMYNQPATGGSDGDWEKETLKTRTAVVANVSKHFLYELNSTNLSIIGTSAGAYMAVRSIESLNQEGLSVKKLVLISPGFYPPEAETLPYGEMFKNIISSPWEINTSPIFNDIKNFTESGGEVLITFFESDDPPIPMRMQIFCKEFAKNLAENGAKIEVITIPGVAHNFRTIGSEESKNVVNNQSVRDTANVIMSFLSRE